MMQTILFLTLIVIPTIACAILVTHLAFFQKRYDYWTIDTLSEYIGYLFYSLIPAMNILLLIMYFLDHNPLKIKLKKFVKK